ncbi:WXG100 family type VII secretion target [Streptomyces sp. CA-249302]|uniref:WXG100 family type VII secretion target n=1 Tax=Streptomyces sp. CA-249302 TaxID=3240058 RepID=UPI003D8C06CD
MARRHSSPEDFRLVGMDSDPTPGDPDLIQGVMQRYRDIGDAAEKALNVLKKDGTISQGRGSAMDQLKEKIGDDLPDKLTKTMNSYHDAAQAYSDYMPRLREAQDTLDRAVDQAQSAAPAANQTPKELGANPTDADKSEARKTQDAIDTGKSELNAAKSLAEQAKSMRESAQRQCADVLDRAAGEAIPERNIFQKIADFFKDFPFVQILLAALIAVVAVFFPVVGALLGGALFVFNQVIASQTGGIKAGDFVVGLLGIVPGGSLLKLGGRAVEAIAPAAVAAVKNSGFIAKSTASITKIGESFSNSKIVSGVLANPIGKVGAEISGNFLKNSALEAGAKAANHDQITAAGVFAGAAAGAVAGAAFKGGIGKIGKGRGNPPVEEGKGGRFGDTTAPAAGDTVGKRASDQLGGAVEEGATLGTKIGVGVAQGGDPNEVAAGEIANSAPKLGAGPVGKAGLGRSIDGIADKIPIKGSPRPSTGAANTLASGQPGTPDAGSAGGNAGAGARERRRAVRTRRRGLMGPGRMAGMPGRGLMGPGRMAGMPGRGLMGPGRTVRMPGQVFRGPGRMVGAPPPGLMERRPPTRRARRCRLHRRARVPPLRPPWIRRTHRFRRRPPARGHRPRPRRTRRTYPFRCRPPTRAVRHSHPSAPPTRSRTPATSRPRRPRAATGSSPRRPVPRKAPTAGVERRPRTTQSSVPDPDGSHRQPARRASMPNYAVNSDTTSSTSQALLNDFSQLQDKLNEVRGKITNLLADGYSTPAAQQKFQPFFDEFAKGFEQVNQGLQGIGQYVKSVGEAFDQTDSQLGSNLS